MLHFAVRWAAAGAVVLTFPALYGSLAARKEEKESAQALAHRAAKASFDN
jgi:hypothetical protein